MAVVTGLTPYDLSKLLAGPCRALWANVTGTAIPANLAEIFAVEKTDNYAPTADYTDFGALVEGAAYNRSIETSGYEIENTTGTVAETVTDVVRSVSLNRGELTAETLQEFEQAPEITPVAGSSTRRPERQVKFGSIESLGRKRIVFVARRPVGVGADVIEQDGTVRGAFVAAVLYNAGVLGDSAAINVAKGQLSSAAMGFKAFPEGGQPQGQEVGFWTEETPGEVGGS
jgi:hypothetical protein